MCVSFVHLPSPPSYTHIYTARVAADTEYNLIGDGSQSSSITIRTHLCDECCSSGSRHHAPSPLDIHHFKPDSEIQELYMQLTDLLPQAKPSDLILRVKYQDRDDAITEVGR